MRSCLRKSKRPGKSLTWKKPGKNSSKGEVKKMFDWLRRRKKFEETKTNATCPVCKKGKLIKQITSEYCDSCGEEFMPTKGK